MGRQDALAYDGREILRGMNGTTAVGTRHIDNALVKAIARTFRWRDMLESANTPPITGSLQPRRSTRCVGGVLRLTLLAPDIVEALLGGRQPAAMQLEDLLPRFPVE
jgi:hypothetical protein